VIGPESLSGELGPTVLGRPDIERRHQPDLDAAVDTAEEMRPHMVVIDLPADDAVDVVRRLRDSSSTRHAAIVWLNRAAAPDLESTLTDAGANVAIPVPIDPVLWDRRLEELLSVPARRTQRIQVQLQDWSSFISGEDEAEGVVLNIGPRGVLLETGRELALGAKMGLRFRLPGQNDDTAAVGEVVRIAGREGSAWRVGVEFLVYRGDARARIAEFVDAAGPAPERPGAPTKDLPLTVRSFDEGQAWEEELRASELRKALILDSARDCIITVDHEGRILEFNSAARRAFGYSRSEILGRALADTVVPPAHREDLRRGLRDFVLTGDNPNLGRQRETTAMRADGTTFPVEVEVVPAFVKGRVLLTAYIRDLTARHRAQRLEEVRHRVTQVLAESLSVAEAGSPLLAALASGLDCEEARLWLVEGDPAHLTLAGSVMGAGTAPRTARPDETVALQVVESGLPVWIEGSVSPAVDSALAVPVRRSGHLLGVLEARNTSPRPRDEEWIAAVSDIGSQVALFLKRQTAEADLQRLARYDSLTGLPNRSFFLNSLEQSHVPPSSFSTSMASRPSTIGSGTPPVTPCYRVSRTTSGPAPAPPTSWPASGETNSPCWCRTSPAPTTLPWWPAVCSTAWSGP